MSIPYEEVQIDKLAYGTPEIAVERLQQLWETLGVSVILAEMNCG